MKDAHALSSILGGSVSVNRRAATTLLNQLLQPGVLILLACLCLSAAAQSNEWTWMGGSSTGSCLLVYGKKGTPAKGNLPGCRQDAMSWSSIDHHLWLFGGLVGGSYSSGVSNDLWEYNPSTSEWTWMGGSKTFYAAGVYGTRGTPAEGNVPGNRMNAMSWTDTKGRFWLFGGHGDPLHNNEYNDLWVYDPAIKEWAWMSGSSTAFNQPGSYITQGASDPGNMPGSRWSAVNWIDKSGTLWLFGGYGYDASGNVGLLNDLWEFIPATGQWAWIGGSKTEPQTEPGCITGKTCGQPGTYAKLGGPDPRNFPGARSGAVSWIDKSNQLWLFGGTGIDANGKVGLLNDLWEFIPATGLWAWMGGSGTVGSNNGQPGNYGTKKLPAKTNIPGGRMNGVSWTDSSGNFWLFGGNGIDANGNGGNLNDLWMYNTADNVWVWMGGSNTIGSHSGQPGVYGTQGTPSAANIPGGRSDGESWTGQDGSMWLYAGEGLAASSSPGILSDLWRYQPPSGLSLTQVVTGNAILSTEPSVNHPDATLNATVNTHGEAGWAWFVVGTTPTLESSSSISTTKTALLSTGNTQNVTGVVNSVKSGTAYYYQAWASTTEGAAHGVIKSFIIK